LYRRLGGTQGWSGRVQKISPPPGFDTRTFRPVASRCTDYAKLAHIPNIIIIIIIIIISMEILGYSWPQIVLTSRRYGFLGDYGAAISLLMSFL
jgi:hypothetical protein